MMRKLFQRVANNLGYWKIRSKVNAVVVAERGIGVGRWRFLPEASPKVDDGDEDMSPRSNWAQYGRVMGNELCASDVI